jgi:drug/metabolite transporter (DMT)-like permease
VKPGELLMLLLLGLIWGSSFLFIKLGVAEVPPLLLAEIRVTSATLLLLAVLRWRGQGLPRDRRFWAQLALVGLINNVLPFTLIPWGEQHIASGLASILNATMPLFTVLLAHFWSINERLNLSRVTGVAVGFVGVLVLIGADLADLTRASTQGELAVIAAAVCYAIATIYARRHLHGHPPMLLATGQLSMAALWLLPLVAIGVRPLPPMPSPIALGSILTLGLLGSGIAYLIYYWLIARITATQLSLVTYLLPITAVFWGAALLGERVGAQTFAGMALILAGIMLVNGAGQGIARRAVGWATALRS